MNENNEAREKNPAAVALGKLAAGKPKNISDEERERRSQRMRDMRRAAIKQAADQVDPKAGPQSA